MVGRAATDAEADAASPLAQRVIADFVLLVPQAKSKHQEDDYRGDAAVLALRLRANAKPVPAEIADKNYLHRYLEYVCRDPHDARKVSSFLSAKLERQRFTQHVGALSWCRSRRLLRLAVC